MPCGNSAWDPVLQSLSCAAQHSRLHASINLCERAINGNGFNTQLVLAADGAVAAVYRKMHPWMQGCFLPGPLHLVSFPLPPLGTPIGIFTCKDILYATPGPALAQAGVRFFAYSAAIPIVGGAAEGAWSKLYNATMMASNADGDQSGVFVRGSRLTPAKVVPGAERLLIADLPALG
jgi:predicted amidohydrolase